MIYAYTTPYIASTSPYFATQSVMASSPYTVAPTPYMVSSPSVLDVVPVANTQPSYTYTARTASKPVYSATSTSKYIAPSPIKTFSTSSYTAAPAYSTSSLFIPSTATYSSISTPQTYMSSSLPVATSIVP